MSFPLETDMYATALEHLPELLGLTSPYAYGIEVPLLYRVADIGFAPLRGGDSSVPQARLLAGLDSLWLWALAVTVGAGEIPEAKFSSVLGRSVADGKRESTLDSLCRAGLLEWSSERGFLPGEWLVAQLGRIIFVELKLSEWKQALNQARFYLQRADIACVVLSGGVAARVPTEPFAAEGVGLLAAWPGRVEMLVPPRPSRRTDTTHRLFNRLRAVQDLCRRRPRKWVLAAQIAE